MVESTVVLGISTDSAHSHRAFADEYRIDFPLLSDSDDRIAEAYGVLVSQIKAHRRVARLALFVVGHNQNVQHA